jgi:hypothetical protein
MLGCGTPDRSGGGGPAGGGGGGGGGTLPQPVTYTLAKAQAATFNAGGYYGLSFSLPSTALFEFSASQATTDTWNVAVFTSAQWVSYQTGSGNMAYGGIHNNVMSAADSLTLPAGEWYLGFRCNNVFQRCMLVFNATATY